MKLIYKIILIFALMACSQNKSITERRTKGSSTPIKEHLTLEKILADSSKMRWVFNTIVLDFSEKNVNLNFNFSCIYSFKTQLKENEIIVFWKHSSDCPYKLLDKDIREPKSKNVFATIQLSCDSSLIINYMDNEWIKQINSRYDTLFPYKMKFKPYGTW